MNQFQKNIFKSKEPEVIVFDPFDYMVVRFIYLKPLEGRDLDIMVYYDGTNTSYDKNAVGYGQSPDSIKIPTDSTPDANSYLWWANDDASSPEGECIEAVVLGVKNFIQNENITTDFINIYLRLGWYHSIGNGNVTIQLQTYLGGSMTKIGTNIVNVGGVLVNNQLKNVRVLSGTGQVTEIKSYLAGTVSYNKINKTAILS